MPILAVYLEDKHAAGGINPQTHGSHVPMRLTRSPSGLLWPLW